MSKYYVAIYVEVPGDYGFGQWWNWYFDGDKDGKVRAEVGAFITERMAEHGGTSNSGTDLPNTGTGEGSEDGDRRRDG